MALFLLALLPFFYYFFTWIYNWWYSITSFKDKIVLVTGGAMGLGKQLVLLFAAGNAKVVIWDLAEEEMKKTIEIANAKSKNQVFGFKIDITNEEEVAKTAELVRNTVGNVDIIVNNAGIVFGNTILESKMSNIKRTFDVNCLSHFSIIKQFLPYMKYGSFIVTIASVCSYLGFYSSADYCASKFAVAGMAESLRQEIKHSNTGIHTLLVHPYFINTGMFNGLKTNLLSWLIAGSPLSEEVVASRIVTAIRFREEQVFIPARLAVLPLLHCLPIWLYDWLHSLVDVKSCMKDFKGRGANFNYGLTASSKSEN